MLLNMNGIIEEEKVKERRVVVPEKPSDFNLVGVIIDMSTAYRFNSNELPFAEPEPPKPVCDCIHYDRGKTTRYYSDGSQRTEP